MDSRHKLKLPGTVGDVGNAAEVVESVGNAVECVA